MDTRTQAIFEDAFSALHRLDNISLVMSFHPQYLESFLRTQHYLLQMDGPLPLHYRHYICIMVRSCPHLRTPESFCFLLASLMMCPHLIVQAAARHQCSYLVNLHVNDFLQVGGNPKWLNGLNEATQKLQQLGEINKILAHRPWLLTKEHIEVSGVKSLGCSCETLAVVRFSNSCRVLLSAPPEGRGAQLVPG